MKRSRDRHFGPDPTTRLPSGEESRPAEQHPDGLSTPASSTAGSPTVPSPTVSSGEVRVRVERFKQPILAPQQARASTSQPQSAGVTQTTVRTPTDGTKRLLREKTGVAVDGTIRQQRIVVQVAAGGEAARKIVPDVRRERGPIYDAYEDREYGGPEDDGDTREGGRGLRNSDDPLRQWAEDHLDVPPAEFLRLEGRGDHRGYPIQLLCASCTVDAHRQLLFHQIEHWTGLSFMRRTLKNMGLRIQLGHWYGPERRCPLPEPASGDDFVIVDTCGVHEVALDYCGCGMGGMPTVQLLCARLYPVTTTNPKSAATFAVLRRFHLLSFESKCAAYEFYQSLARETDNMRYKGVKMTKTERAEAAKEGKGKTGTKNMKDRYHEFLRMTRQWCHLQMLKHAGCGHDPEGVAKTAPGSCALLCPVCPQPGKNLPRDWKDAPEERQFLYVLFLAMDANFRLKRKDVSTEEKDPGLGKGWVFFADVEKYMAHVKKWWNEKQERSPCVAHDAVDKPDCEARGTASSGIGAVDCACHNMKRPMAVGDLQLGEWYMNMDYMFFGSLVNSELIRLFVSYDIACQWHINIWTRMLKYDNEELMVDGDKFMTFLIPKFHLPAHIEACNLKFSFNLTRDVGQTDGEAPERGWADTNPLARSTKEMGPGSRRDTLDDHFNDWNHKKIIALGYALRRKIHNAVPEMVETKKALEDMEESMGSEVVAPYTAMAELWENNADAPNPFEMLRKDEHIAKVRRELAAEAAAREVAGTQVAADVRGDIPGWGYSWKTSSKRTLAFDVAATGLHPTDNQCRAMIERTSKTRRKIFAWIDIQTKFYPQLVRLRELEDEAQALSAGAQAVPGIKISDIALWLPSAIAAAPGPDAKEVSVPVDVQEHEYRLRVGQAGESLHELCRLLLVRTHLYKLKDWHSRGVRANTRSWNKIAALNNQVQRAAMQYRVARGALVVLGRVLKRTEWEWSFQELKEEDVRGLPRRTFSDPERQKGKKRMEKEIRGEVSEPGDQRAMNEAVHIEWAKARTCSGRWQEEVDLVEEEMHRVPEFLRWRAGWWQEQVGLQGLPEGPQLEGETAYALRQATLQTDLAARFTKAWVAVPELIRRGCASEVLADAEAGDAEGEGEKSDDEEEESSNEEEAIPSIPARELKASYVDEVLAM
ncbi:hypothetical protein C8R44DRAFT_891305 [Mycena epipterygia]|nr:hypothetical protein C8R44DRAFT_891305 [Mycena epipterygia]